MTFLLFLLIFVVGGVVGSFLNAWIWRTHQGISCVRRRSKCPECKETLKPKDLIPVVSFFLLRGRCRYCHKKIPLSYLAIELWCGLVFVFLGLYHQVNVSHIPLAFFRDVGIVAFLTVIFVYDFLYQEILDRVTLTGAGVLFVFSVVFGWQSSRAMLFGMLVGAGFFLLQFFISGGRWIGGGDIRLGLLMGVILGWPLIILGLMLSYFLGMMVSIILLALKKKTLTESTPFGTYLSVGTFIVMLWGEKIVAWYMSNAGYI